MYEKLTKWPDFTQYLPEKYFPDFFSGGGGKVPLPPRLLRLRLGLQPWFQIVQRPGQGWSPSKDLQVRSLQGRCADVQSFTRKCAAVSGTTCCCCRSARPTDITLWVAPIVWWCHLSDVQQSVTGRSRVAGPRVWNTPPEEITTSQTLSTFRQQFKTWRCRTPALDSENHIRTSSSEPAFRSYSSRATFLT